MTGAELNRLAADLGLDVVGAARAEPYLDTEQHIRDRRARGSSRTCASRWRGRRSPVTPSTSWTALERWSLLRSATSRMAPSQAPTRVACRATRGATSTHCYASGSNGSVVRSAARTASSSTRTTTSTVKPPSVRASRSTGRTRWRSRGDTGLGRPRSARHGRRDRAVSGSRARLRLVSSLHRRLPDGCARRARCARRDEVPFVLDAGAGSRARGVQVGASRFRLRLRHLPGRLPVEPRGREEASWLPIPEGEADGSAARLARGGRRGADRRLRPSLRSAKRGSLAAAKRADRCRKCRQRRAREERGALCRG